MPVSTSINFQDSQIQQFNTDADVFWDFPDVQLRRAMVGDSHTTAALVPMLLTAQTRLREDGDTGDAAFFEADQVQSFQAAAVSGMGDTLLQSLLFTEAEIIRGATSALKDVNGMLSNANSSPTAAIERFASFGADLTDTFNQKLSSVYGDDSLRTLSTVMLAEASQAIDPGVGGTVPSAMLSILTLKNDHSFDLNDFISGNTPPREQVALSQTLVNLAP